MYSRDKPNYIGDIPSGVVLNAPQFDEAMRLVYEGIQEYHAMRYDALGRRAGCYDREEVYGETTTRFMTQLIKECAIGESEDSEVR